MNEIAARARLIARAKQLFKYATRAAPVWAWHVPGRLEVFGKHTDYAGGRSLVAALPRGLAFVAAPRTDNRVLVLDGTSGDVVVVERDVAASPVRWGRYPLAVVRALHRHFPGAPLGADIAFISDLPSAAGLSSSSALIVGVALALIECGGLRDRPEWQAALSTPLDLAAYLAAIEGGRSFGPFPGEPGVGTLGGAEDHTAMLASRPGCVTAFRYLPAAEIGHASVPPHWTFAIATSGVIAEKTGAAQALYNDAALAVARLLEIWNANAPGALTLAGALASVPDAEARLRARLPTGAEGRRLGDRLTHFIREDARIPTALAAVASADAAAMSDLASGSQEDADRLLGTQTEETQALVDLAHRHGAAAATNFGAGFGGSVWALVTERHAAEFVRDWTAAYRLRYPDRAAACDSFVTQGAAAVTSWPVA